MANSSQLDRNSRFDLIRGLAIASVVFIHTSQVLINAASKGSTINPGSSFIELWGMFAEFGQYGVELFFVLSGALLYRVYAGEQKTSQPFNIRAYSFRRLGRIYPLWLLFALASLALSIFNRGWWFSLSEIAGQGVLGNLIVGASTLLFLTWALIPSTTERALAGGWSIESEMAHYLIFPIVRKFSPAKLTLLIGICGVLAGLNDFALEKIENLNWLTMRIESLSILTTAPFFLAGMLMGHFQHTKVADVFFAAIQSLKIKKVRGALTLTGFGLLLGNDLPYGSVVGATLFCFLAISVSTFLSRSGALSKTLVSLGKYSYFTYFFHFWLVSAVIFGLGTVEPSFLSELLVGIWWAVPIMHLGLFGSILIVCQAFGHFSYRFIENPWIQKSRYA